MLRTSLVTTAILAAFAALGGCKPTSAVHEDIRPVRTLTLGAPAGVTSASYSGEIRARRENALGFQVAGRIQQRLVEVGDSVSAGAPLLKLDPVDTALNAEASRMQVESARSRMAQAQQDLQRYRTLAEKGFVGRAELDKTVLAMDNAVQTFKAAEASYRVAANQARYTTLSAGAAGVVTAIDVEVGRVVQAGQVVIHLAENGERELLVSVPESRVDELRNARGLTIELWANTQQRYRGRVRELAPDTDAVTRTYAARISVLDADAALRLGMTAKLIVDLAAPEGLHRLPLTAILDTQGKPGVWLVDAASGRVGLHDVVIVQMQKDSVLVKAGVKDGDVVVTAGVNLLHPGQKVRFTESLQQIAER